MCKKNVNFSHTKTSVRSAPIIFRQPALASIENIFIAPLEESVWYVFVAAMLTMWLVMQLQFIYPENRERLTRTDLGMFVIGAACQQATDLVVLRTSGRIIVLITFTLSMLLYFLYSSNILLLLQSQSTAITKIDDFLSSPLKFAIQDTKYNRAYYLHENNSNLNKLYERKIKEYEQDGWISDTDVGLEKVRTQLFAYQVETPSAYNKYALKAFAEDEKCSLTEIYVFRLPRLASTVIRNCPYRELFRQR